jgi:quinolinate synthase
VCLIEGSIMDATSAPASSSDIMSLCERLRSERLLVASEHETLKHLNKSIERDLNSLCEKIWICRHEQVSLFIKLKNSI